MQLLADIVFLTNVPFVKYLLKILNIYFLLHFLHSFWVYFKTDMTKKLNKALNLEPCDILLCSQNPYFSDKQIYIINL